MIESTNQGPQEEWRVGKYTSGRGRGNELSISQIVGPLLFIAICVGWIGLDQLTGQLYQMQIISACFILACVLFLRSSTNPR